MIKAFLFMLFVFICFLIFYKNKDENNYFYYEDIPENIKKKMMGNSYQNNDNIGFNDLVYVHVLHIGFDSLIHSGELVVNRMIADDIVAIFKELYIKNYKIEKVKLIDEYGGNDEESMMDNNTSAFNYRNIEGTDRLSNHSYGLAIDINPLYNPCVTENKVLPSISIEYVDRDKEFMAKIEKDDICYKAFIKRGFIWGGEFNTIKDYHHFEKIKKDI